MVFNFDAPNAFCFIYLKESSLLKYYLIKSQEIEFAMISSSYGYIKTWLYAWNV